MVTQFKEDACVFISKCVHFFETTINRSELSVAKMIRFLMMVPIHQGSIPRLGTDGRTSLDIFQPFRWCVLVGGDVPITYECIKTPEKNKNQKKNRTPNWKKCNIQITQCTKQKYYVPPMANALGYISWCETHHAYGTGPRSGFGKLLENGSGNILAGIGWSSEGTVLFLLFSIGFSSRFHFTCWFYFIFFHFWNTCRLLLNTRWIFFYTAWIF